MLSLPDIILERIAIYTYTDILHPWLESFTIRIALHMRLDVDSSLSMT